VPSDDSRTLRPDAWQALELRHLVALAAVARHDTVGRAALALGYTQSAISQQIAALERIVGEPLFERPGGRRSMQITAAGRLMLRHGEAILARAHAAQADLAALRDGQYGVLRLGIYQSVGEHVLPALLPGFRARWPGVQLRLHESASDVEMWRMLERADLDLAFCMLPLDAECLAARELLRDPYLLVVPAGSPLARRRRPPPLSHIARLNLIGFRSCRNEHRIDALLRSRGYAPTVALRSDDNRTVQRLVATGLGVALMPRLTVDLDDEATVAIPMGDTIPHRLLGIAWHRDRVLTPAADAFIAAAAAVCFQLGAADAPLERAAI
jgi:DNA-binding transcriptional LysR family regulator